MVPGFDGWVEFNFDEVINEGTVPNFGTGRGLLEKEITVSPDSGVPQVRWHRSRIEVRPRSPWRDSTVYRIEIGTGLGDLRNNDLRDPIVLTFTTGAPVPTRYITGSAVDWVARRFVPRALVTATYATDSAVYRTFADSSGKFRFGPLPDGDVLMTVSVESGQPDGILAPTREAWDSVRLLGRADSVGEVWAFGRDTVPPRMGQGGASRSDSFAISLALSQPVAPGLRLGPDAISVLIAPDSTPLGAIAALPRAAYDSIYGPIDSARRAQGRQMRQAAREDSVKAARADSMGITVATLDSIIADSLKRNPAAEPTPVAKPDTAVKPTTPPDTSSDEPTENRPPLGNLLLIRLNGALEAGTRYLIEVRGVRAMSGEVADTIRTQLVLEAAKPVVADSAGADSIADKPDSTRADTAETDSALVDTTRAGTILPKRPPHPEPKRPLLSAETPLPGRGW